MSSRARLRARPRFQPVSTGTVAMLSSIVRCGNRPVCWITNAFDRSPGQIVRVERSAWGPLEGALLNLSYGYGKIFVVLPEVVEGQMQGGMATLPIPQFPTGIMRGRFHPRNGQLYTCGMYA